MKKIVIFMGFFISVMLLSFANVSAGEKVDKTLDVADKGEVEISNSRGNIEVTGWDKNKISVKGELDDLTERFIFTTSGNKTLIKVELPDRSTSSRSGDGSNLKIFVPLKFSVQFGGIATDITISNIESKVDVNSVSGDIELDKIDSRTYINSVSGNIDLKNINGAIEISTVSGDVKAMVSSTNIFVSGVSSDISVKTDKIESAQISTVSGDSSLTGYLVNDGSVKLSNVSGNSHFMVKSDLNADVLLDTGPGGDVKNKYSDDKAERSFIGSEKLKFTAGNGNGLVRMSTVSGEVIISKEK